MMKRFQVAFTHDYLLPNGDFALDDYDLSPLEECPDVELRFLPEVATLTPEMIEDVDALVASPMAIDIPRSSFHTNKRLTLIARTGVGYNEVDMQAATEHGVAVALATDGVRRPTAVGALAMILAATIHLVPKDRIARLGPEGWARSGEYQGLGLIGRTLGIIGFGSIGQEVVHLTRPLDLRFIAFDPYADPHAAQRLGVELVELDRLMAEADIVSVHCLLTDETRGFIDARRLGLMKPSAYLVNMARGPVVDQDALTEVLKARRIAGAALDVLCEEPPPTTRRSSLSTTSRCHRMHRMSPTSACASSARPIPARCSPSCGARRRGTSSTRAYSKWI